MILWALATIGFALLSVDSSFFKPLRQWIGKPFSCYQCMGFWAGIWCWVILDVAYPDIAGKVWYLKASNLIAYFCAVGFAGSALTVITVTVLDCMGKYER